MGEAHFENGDVATRVQVEGTINYITSDADSQSQKFEDAFDHHVNMLRRNVCSERGLMLKEIAVLRGELAELQGSNGRSNCEPWSGTGRRQEQTCEMGVQTRVDWLMPLPQQNPQRGLGTSKTVCDLLVELPCANNPCYSAWSKGNVGRAVVDNVSDLTKLPTPIPNEDLSHHPRNTEQSQTRLHSTEEAHDATTNQDLSRVGIRRAASASSVGLARGESKDINVVNSANLRKSVGTVHHISKALSAHRLKQETSDILGSTWLTRFVLSVKFDQCSALLVITNSFFIGVQVELMYTTESTPEAVAIVDYVYCICFLVEICLRILGFGVKGFFIGRDRSWNTFDFFIVSFSTMDAVMSIVASGQNTLLSNISILRTLRILRVTRVLRIIRVMKFFVELRVMISAIASTLKVACWAFLLLVLAMYLFGTAIASLAAE